MTELPDQLATELERPRDVPAQVVNHVVGNYDVGRDDIGRFLAGELPKLEDYEVDLILSPVFTPTLSDQSVFATLLGRNSIPRDQWPALVQQLVARPTRAQLVTEDGRTHTVPLRDVTIERYVHRLRLDAAVPEPLFNLVNHLPPAADRPMLKAIARRAVWDSDPRRDILMRYLSTAIEAETYRLEDAIELLKLMETYQPADAAEVVKRIPHWQQVLRQEIHEAASPKPFFNERVQELHGGGRDQRRQDDSRLGGKQRELEFLDRLEKLLR